MHEIVTLSLGRYANYLTTHLLNTKEDYLNRATGNGEDDEDGDGESENEVYFQASSSSTSPPFPRLVHFDLSDGFGGARRYHAQEALEDPPDGSNGLERLQVFRQDPIARHDYLAQLEQEEHEEGGTEVRPFAISNWSDFSRLCYHKRSFQALPPASYTYANADSVPFDHPKQGWEEFHQLDRARHDGVLDDVIRPWTEACESMQGFQVLTTTSDAWSGFSRVMLERLEEQYGKKIIMTTGLSQAGFGAPGKAKRLHDAQAMVDLAEASTLYLPCLDARTATVPSPWLKGLDVHSAWETSALLSGLLETVTLPAQLAKTNGERLHSLREMSDQLNWRDVTPIVGLEGSFQRAPLIQATTSEPAPTQDTTHGYASLQVDRISSDGRDGREGEAGHLRVTTCRPYPLPSSFPRHLFGGATTAVSSVSATLFNSSRLVPGLQSALDLLARERRDSDGDERIERLHGYLESYQE